jgi:hypothetical protein
MRDVVKMMLIPISGAVGIALIFLLVVWAGNFQKPLINEEGQYGSVSRDLGGYAVIKPTECDGSYFPVCGMDGKTYDNACKAVDAGTKVAHRGACES